MSKEKTIEHKARVIFIDGDRIDVEMIVEGACASCKAKKACGMEDEEKRIVSLLTQSAKFYEVGEEVNVYIEHRMGMKAAAYAYIYPFFLMLIVLLTLNSMELSELVVGLSTLGAAVIYYIILSFFKGRIEKEIIFKLAKL